MLEIDIKLLPFQGVTNERALTQGVASLALGYVHHWAFSPSLLNPKLQYGKTFLSVMIFFWGLTSNQISRTIQTSLYPPFAHL